MPDESSYQQRLLVAESIHRPIVLDAIAALDLPNGSSGLDAGCGIGLQCHSLACAVGDGGHVTGLDISPDLLGVAEERAKRAGLSERISYTPGDIRRLPFPDRSFDWVWSANCVGYAPLGDPQRLVREMARVVRPSGMVAILAWSSEKLLPGYPLLEARLAATAAGIAPFISGRPARKPLPAAVRLPALRGPAGNPRADLRRQSAGTAVRRSARRSCVSL